MNDSKTGNITEEIAAYRMPLFRLALLQLRDEAAADDATQEALLAALESHTRFEGRSSLKTWLISILRFKVLDIIRANKRTLNASSLTALGDELDVSVFDVLFEENGCWTEPKDAWSDPQSHVEQLQFFKILDACLTKLPPLTARAFLMREWLELTPDETCSQIGVSAGNLRVILYRARMQLRHCLDLTWDRN